MKSQQVDIVITREIVEIAARGFVRRFILRSSKADIVFVCLGAVLGIAGIVIGEYAIGSMIIGLVAVGLVFIGLVVAAAMNYVRMSRSKFRAMTDPTVSFTFNEETLGTKSCLGSVEVPWKVVTAIWKYDDVWLLFFGGHGYSVFPVKQLSPDVTSFVEERVRANGGKVS